MFVASKSAGGIILMIAALAAIIANSPLLPNYQDLLVKPVRFSA